MDLLSEASDPAAPSTDPHPSEAKAETGEKAQETRPRYVEGVNRLSRMRVSRLWHGSYQKPIKTVLDTLCPIKMLSLETVQYKDTSLKHVRTIF